MEMNLPWVESPFFLKILKSKNLNSDFEKIAIDYNREGYVVLKNVFSKEEIDEIILEMNEKAFNPTFKYKHQRDERRSQDLWEYSEPVRKMACKKEVLDVLEFLYDRETVPFQTLNFRYGSQQRAHSDTIHFSSLPARFMCGVWVALEDITEENGPLFYYPGSQKSIEFNFNHFRKDLIDNSYDNYNQYEDFIEEYLQVANLEKKKFLAKKGDALIWSSNIIHGGCPVLQDGETRYSQVTHYFFKDCIYYSPMGSNTISGELAIRYHLKNMRTGKVEKMTYNGYDPHLIRTFKFLTVINKHIYYPGFLRLITDFVFIVSNFGFKHFFKLFLNKTKIKKL